MTRTPNYHHGNLREELLLAALEMLDNEGSEGVGIRQVARQVGVAHSAPANHFKNKQALYTALATMIFQDLFETIRRELETRSDDLRSAIHHFAQTVLDYGLEHPNRFKFIWQREHADRADNRLHEILENIYRDLTSLLQEHAKRKHVDVESQAIALWSLIHGYVSLRLDGNLEAGVDEVTGLDRQKAIIDVMLDGISS